MQRRRARRDRVPTVVAATPMRVPVLTSAELSGPLNRHETVARKVLRELAGRVRALEGAPEFA